MCKTTTERGLIEPGVPVEGSCGIYATDDGMVQLVSKHDGVTRTIDFTPEEWDQVAVGGIKMGMIAKSAVMQKRMEIAKAVDIPPELASLIAKANGRS
jgi:hypothetical protein